MTLLSGYALVVTGIAAIETAIIYLSYKRKKNNFTSEMMLRQERQELKKEITSKQMENDALSSELQDARNKLQEINNEKNPPTDGDSLIDRIRADGR